MFCGLQSNLFQGSCRFSVHYGSKVIQSKVGILYEHLYSKGRPTRPSGEHKATF